MIKPIKLEKCITCGYYKAVGKRCSHCWNDIIYRNQKPVFYRNQPQKDIFLKDNGKLKRQKLYGYERCATCNKLIKSDYPYCSKRCKEIAYKTQTDLELLLREL
jgi:hypothetical protein